MKSSSHTQARGACPRWTITTLWKTKICLSYMVTNSFWIMFKEKTESQVHICFQLSPLLHSHHYCFCKRENSLQWLSAKHQRFTCEDGDSRQVCSPRQSESIWRHSEQKLLSHLCVEKKKTKSTSLKGILSVPCIDVDLEESQPRTKIYLYQKQ